MGPICTHRAIAKHAVIVWLDRKTIMAAETSTIVLESKKKKTCIMVEEDVPGAVLPSESVEECSAVKLKRWFTCIGAKTSGKKSALVYISE